MMACPKAYKDELAAKLAAGKILVQSKGKQEPKAIYCNMCKKWHLKEGK
jgi:hypothetical protein